MSWEIALVGSLVLVILGLFYLVGVFDKSEHPMFKLFLFFIGLFLIIISFSVDSNILLANSATIDATAYTNLIANINTAYWIGMMVLFVSLMYWMIYFLRQGLNMLKIKRKMEVEG